MDVQQRQLLECVYRALENGKNLVSIPTSIEEVADLLKYRVR